MGKPLNKNFNLERFVEAYISNALELARTGLSAEEFYSKLHKIISQSIDLDKEQVVYLHHAFHWYLFNRNSKSLLEITKPKTNKEIAVVRLIEGIKVNKKTLLRGFLEEHRDYLEQRVRTLQQS